MTKENCTRLLKHYKDVGYTSAYENMKEHILKGSKFTQEEKDTMFKVAKTTTTTKSTVTK